MCFRKDEAQSAESASEDAAAAEKSPKEKLAAAASRHRWLRFNEKIVIKFYAPFFLFRHSVRPGLVAVWWPIILYSKCRSNSAAQLHRIDENFRCKRVCNFGAQEKGRFSCAKHLRLARLYGANHVLR